MWPIKNYLKSTHISNNSFKTENAIYEWYCNLDVSKIIVKSMLENCYKDNHNVNHEIGIMIKWTACMNYCCSLINIVTCILITDA